MFLSAVGRRAILPAVLKQHQSIKSFHISHYNCIRRISSSESFINDCNSEYSEKSIDPAKIAEDSNKDFFGIESDEGVIIIEPLKKSNEEHLIEPLYGVKGNSREKFYRTRFGVIRQDSDNKLNVHGQYENMDTVFPYKSTEHSEVIAKHRKQNNDIFNVLYNKSHDHNFRNNELSSEGHFPDGSHFETSLADNKAQEKNLEDTDCSDKHQDLNYIDEFFFGNADKDISDKTIVKNNSVEELSYLDENFFGKDVHSKSSLPHETCKNVDFPFNEENLKHNTLLDLEEKELASVRDVKHEVANKTSSERLKYPSKYSPHTMNSIDYVKNETKEKILMDNEHLDVKNSHQIEIESYKEFNAQYLSKNDLTDYNIQSKQTQNPMFGKTARKQYEVLEKKYVNSSEHVLGTESDSADIRESDSADSIHSETFKPSVFEKKVSDKIMKTNKLCDLDNRTTAYEFVTSVRKEQQVENQADKKVISKAATEEKKDSKGFRILTNQVPDLSQFTRDEIMTLLKRNILYTDDNLLILNKPYSLVLHDSKTTKSPCLSLFLDDLAKDIDDKTADLKLYTVHRLDKETTGCLLLARNEGMADNLKSLFAQRKIIKKYWILTSKVPDPPQGVIDIPISEGSVDNKRRMVLNPQLPKDIPYRNHSKSGKGAVTSYKVLSVSGNAALVEAIPETGIKHQIRVHFGFGLSCPILGDHKYSHLDKMAPQKLPSDLLQKLHVRQSKVRYIPMHIHAHSITIPGYLDGRDLYVSAPLPAHMRANLQRLKFKKKNKFVL